MKLSLIGFVCSILVACQPGLDRQPKIPARGYFPKPEDVRMPPQGTVEFSSSALDQAPPPENASTLERGKQRYQIYCSVCHGRSGGGDGLAIERGFQSPPPFAGQSLTPAETYQIIRNGKDQMKGFSNRVPPSDCWAIAQFVQTLQRGKP